MSGLVAPIDSLPNEILIAILTTFSTPTLLPLTLVDRRFKAIVTRLVQHRLLRTADLGDNEVLLECYHPSAKLSTPSLSCRYLGTNFLDRTGVADELGFGELSQLYSRFQPVVREENRWPRRSEPIPSQETRTPEGQKLPSHEPATQEVILDECELFSQLCTAPSLVKVGPRPGLYLRHTNVGDGLVRVWRDWLADAAKTDASADSQSSDLSNEERWLSTNRRILWADAARNVGLRFRVTKTSTEGLSVMYGSGEDPPVAYSLQYEELVVRTSKVLLAVEKSAVQEIAHSGYLMKLDGKKAHPVKTIFWSNMQQPLSRPVAGW